MCESKIFLEKEGGELEEVMENVVTIEEQDGKVRLVDLFGTERIMDARIHTFKMLDHKVILTPNK